MALNAAQVKARIGDELGLTDEDLARLYGVDAGKLDKHLASLEKDAEAVSQRILSDVDGVRTGYRMLQVSDAHIAAVRELLKDYIFHPLVSTEMADGHVGWKLGSDDAQFVAFRVADIVGMDHDWSEVLRLRLKRLIVWPNENMPQTNREFRDRVADITFYLVELTGVL